MENKVQFNLKNVHYAKLTEAENSVTWGTPKHVPGAVTLTLSPEGEITQFYADGIIYYQSVANNGYKGDLEMARFPDEMLKDIWGFVEGATSHVLTENANVEPSAFALLFEIDGDADHQRYAAYNCAGTRPAVSSKTNTNTKEPQTQTSNITVMPLASGSVMGRTSKNTPASTFNSWYDAVYLEEESVYTVQYNANGGTGNVLDGNSPYASGATVKILAATGLTAPTSKTFSKWNTAPDGSGEDYDPSDTLTIAANTTLYAIWQ